MFTVIDLFSGAGGLSEGFKEAGFDIKAAYEKSLSAQKTYRENFPGVRLYGDIIDADYQALQKQLGTIDVVIGGPPCQGFSNANRQHNHAISLNNKLVKEYVRAILAIRPKAFVMENVGMLRSAVHRFYMEEGDRKAAEQFGLPFTSDEILLLGNEFLFEEAEDIAQDPAVINRLLWEEEDFHCLQILKRQKKNAVKLKAALNKYRRRLQAIAERIRESSTDIGYLDEQYERFASALSSYYSMGAIRNDLCDSAITMHAFHQMLRRLKEIERNSIIIDGFDTDVRGLFVRVKSCAVSDYIRKTVESLEPAYTTKGAVLNAADFGVPQKRMRYILIGLRRDIFEGEVELPTAYYRPEQYQTVYDAIHDLEGVPASQDKDAGPIALEEYHFEGSPVGRALRDSEKLYNHFCTATRKTALERFASLKEGQNFHDLDDSLKSTYTDAERTQNTIYLRLTYNQPSGTVVNVRKSMWIHPKLNRALTVREAARLQSFPDSFRFIGSKDQQYQQVGNAVPPLLAKAIADHILKILKEADNVETLL